MKTTNHKYEITDIAHVQYPFLHRIRALRNIGPEVNAGELGGFVESESNLSYEPDDDAWIFDNAIACNGAYVDQGASLRDCAVPVIMPTYRGTLFCPGMHALRMIRLSAVLPSPNMPGLPARA